MRLQERLDELHDTDWSCAPAGLPEARPDHHGGHGLVQKDRDEGRDESPGTALTTSCLRCSSSHGGLRPYYRVLRIKPVTTEKLWMLVLGCGVPGILCAYFKVLGTRFPGFAGGIVFLGIVIAFCVLCVQFIRLWLCIRRAIPRAI
jgi:hypothetical protein